MRDFRALLKINGRHSATISYICYENWKTRGMAAWYIPCSTHKSVISNKQRNEDYMSGNTHIQWYFFSQKRAVKHLSLKFRVHWYCSKNMLIMIHTDIGLDVFRIIRVVGVRIWHHIIYWIIEGRCHTRRWTLINPSCFILVLESEIDILN